MMKGKRFSGKVGGVVFFLEVKMIENMSSMYLKTAQVPDPIKRQPKNKMEIPSDSF